jgi:FkbM family methyltransferase
MAEILQRRMLHLRDDQGRQRIALAYPDEPSIRELISRILTGHEYVIPGRIGDYLRAMANPVFIDVGAHVGAAAIFFRNCFPKGTVYSFEPARDAFSFLKENTRPFPEIRAFPYGLYSRDCDVRLFRGQMHSAANSIVRNDLTTGECVIVRMARASDELARLGIDRLAVLKIDTEGCELPILDDLRDRLPRIDVIFVEYHSEADRLAIDAMLTRDFILFYARADLIHRGVYGYVAKRLRANLPGMDEYEISGGQPL